MGMKRDKNRIQVPHQLNGIIFPSTLFFFVLAKKKKVKSKNCLHQERLKKYKKGATEFDSKAKLCTEL